MPQQSKFARIASSIAYSALGFFISLGVSASLFAAEETGDIEEVAVVSNRIAVSSSELSGSITSINQEALELIAPVHIQEVLSRVPGVNFQRGSGQETLPSIRSAVLTGAGACGSNLIMEEGIPVRGAGFCNVNELFDTHFEQAGQIEILRGAQSAFYGSNGLTGSINVVLPSDADSQITLESGSDSYLRIKSASQYGNEGNQGSLYLTHTDDGGFRADSGYSQQKLSVRHRYDRNKLDIQAGLTATWLDQDTAGFILGLNSYRDESLARQNLNPEAFRDTRALRAWSAFNWQLNPNQSLQIKPYLRTTDMDFRLHFLPGKPLEENRQTGFGWQSSFTTQAQDHYRLSVGLDYEQGRGYLRQSQQEPTQGSAFLQATIPTGIHYDYKVDAEQVGVFIHLDYEITDWLKFIAGTRFEHIVYDYDNRALDGRTRDDGSECGFGGCRYSRPADDRDSFNHVSPKLEVQYRISDSTTLRVSAADAFRAPQATELYRLQRDQSIADLDTVEVLSYETGLNYSSAKLELDLALYRLKQKNLIIRDSDFFNVNGQETDSSGFEISTGYALSERWNARLAASYAEHKYASNPDQETLINGNWVDTAPRLVGSLGLEYRWSDSLTQQLELNHVSRYYLDIDNAFEYPGHTLLSSSTRYQFNDQWSFGLRVNNLLDKRYADRADYTSFSGYRYFPGRPRTLFINVSRQFF